MLSYVVLVGNILKNNIFYLYNIMFMRTLYGFSPTGDLQCWSILLQREPV